MKARRSGRIIQIGSEVFEKGVPQFSNYVQAKGAQLGLTRSWANELAPWQITVNLVAPGWIPTERHAGDSQEMKDAYAAGRPDEADGRARGHRRGRRLPRLRRRPVHHRPAALGQRRQHGGLNGR